MIVLGMGRVGQGLARQAAKHEVPFTPIDRTNGWSAIDDAQGGEPILVCTNPDDLSAVIDRTPDRRRSDLVFVQNGMLDTFLSAQGRSGNARGLLYFAAASRGADIQPGGTSIFTGPHAEAVVAWFHSMGLDAERVSRSKFTSEMVEKLMWNCVFGLLCETKGATVGELVERDRETIEALAVEMVAVANKALGTMLEAQPVVNNLCAYSMTIPSYQGSLKQRAWRNGWFVEAAIREGLVMPIHNSMFR